MLSGAVAKVTCRTCLTTHDYRHAEVPARRKSKAKEKAALIEQVLSGMPGGSPPPPAVPPDATPPDAPPVRKKRDLWAEVNRIQQQNKK
jgi:hypothetical protein